MKLTKKQNEIVTKVKNIEEETGKTVYFMYNELSRKIHAVIVKLKENNQIELLENKGILCTHITAMTMESKGILIPEVVDKFKKYANEEKLYDFTLLKLF